MCALNFPSFLLISPLAPLFLSMLVLLRKAVGAFFIYMLFVSADILAIKHLFSHSSAQGREGSRCKLHSHIIDRKPWLQNASWFAVEITRGLRCIWKFLRQESDGNHVRGILWFLSMTHVLVKMGEHRKKVMGALHPRMVAKNGVVFLRYFVQLLCCH